MTRAEAAIFFGPQTALRVNTVYLRITTSFKAVIVSRAYREHAVDHKIHFSATTFRMAGAEEAEHVLSRSRLMMEIVRHVTDPHGLKLVSTRIEGVPFN